MALISEDTISHGEHSCLYLESCCDVAFIGQTTNGTNGNVSNVVLPGNITVTFTALGALHGNGQQLQRYLSSNLILFQLPPENVYPGVGVLIFIRKGIQPHVVVTPQIQDLTSSVDRTLQVAIQFLSRSDRDLHGNKNMV